MSEMIMSTYSINLSNFLDIPFDKYCKDFTFIFNGKRYQTNRVFADFLSPDIRKLHCIDGSINEFDMDLAIIHKKSFKSMKYDNFGNFLNLPSSDQHLLTQKEKEEYSFYYYVLGNMSECFKLRPDFNKNLKTNNVIDRLLFIQNCTNENFPQISIKNDIINFIASNFEFIDKQELSQVNIDIIDSILSSEKLSIIDEDSLLTFILHLYEQDRSFSQLFKNIYFENLSEAAFETFSEAFKFEDIDLFIWHSVLNRRETVSTTRSYIKSNRQIKRIKKLRQNGYGSFKIETLNDVESEQGVFNFLTKKTGGNLHDNGTIEISSNSIKSGDQRFHPKNIVDFGEDNFYASDDDEYTTICFDFKERFIQPSSYILKTCKGGENSAHLRNWVLEASNDGQIWAVIDSHSDEQKMRGRLFSPVFKVNGENKNYYRYVRIRQTGESWYSKKKGYYFILREFEIFGKLKDLKVQKQN